MDIPKNPFPTNIKIPNACSGISGGVEDMEYHNMSLLGNSIWHDNKKICEDGYKFGDCKLQRYKMATDVGVEKIRSHFLSNKDELRGESFTSTQSGTTINN